MKTKGKIIAFLLITLFILTLSTPVYAQYQSIYQSDYGNYVRTSNSSWISVRNMEAEGKGMGLKETLASDGSYRSNESNNIDVHMMKNTEWGAIALLSASPQYGKQGEGTARYVFNGTGLTTSTGNVYGVYYSGAITWVASTTEYLYNKSKTARRYLDLYGNTAKAGDAHLSWHGARGIALPDNYYWIVRTYGSIFGGYKYYHSEGCYRAAAVCGLGF